MIRFGLILSFNNSLDICAQFQLLKSHFQKPNYVQKSGKKRLEGPVIDMFGYYSAKIGLRNYILSKKFS